MKQNITEETVYSNFPVRAAEPLISAKGDAQTEGLNFVTSRLKEGKKIKTGDIQTNLQSCTCSTNSPQKTPEKVKEPVIEEIKKPKSEAFCHQPGEAPEAIRRTPANPERAV